MQQTMQLPELSREEIEKLWMMSNSFYQFLHHIKFKGDWKTALSLERQSEQEHVVDSQNTDCVDAFIGWQLSFKHDIRPLWLTRNWRTVSPIPRVMGVIQKLDKYAFPITTHCSRHMTIYQNCSGLDVGPIHPNAGCGASPSLLVIEGCLYQSSEWQEIVRNLYPALWSVTKGKGSIITINPPI